MVNSEMGGCSLRDVDARLKPCKNKLEAADGMYSSLLAVLFI